MTRRLTASNRRPRGPRAMARAVLVALPLAAVAACAGPSGSPGGADRLAVLGLDSASTPGLASGQWHVESAAPLPLGRLTVVNRDGVPALRVTSGPDALAVVHEVDAALLAAPYLSWSWNIDRQSSGLHPVRLIVGFRGGYPESGRLKRGWISWERTFLPPAERTLAIVWADTALQRGNLTVGTEGPDAMAVYTVRGGRENAGAWFMETVDLADLYTRAWPEDDLAHTKVAFVAVAAGSGPQPVSAYVSGIKLSR